MKPIGPIIKKHIEENGLVKKDIAGTVGISYNYLSTIFNKTTIDAELLEKICVAIKLNPAVFFDVTPEMQSKQYSDISATTFVGNAAVQIGRDILTEKIIEEKERVIAEKDKLLEEKERTIQILLDRKSGTDSGHHL